MGQGTVPCPSPIRNLIVWGIGLFVPSEMRYAKKYIVFGANVWVKYFVFLITLFDRIGYSSTANNSGYC